MAAMLATALTGLFAYLNWSNLKPIFLTAHEDADAVVIVPSKAPDNLATHSLQQNLGEPIQAVSESTWLNYRSRPASLAMSELELKASARLMAPQAVAASIDDRRPSKSSNMDGGEPLGLPDRDPPSALTVSSQRGIPALDLSGGNRIRQIEASSSEHSVWPHPELLIEDLRSLQAAAGESYPRLSIWTEQIIGELALLRYRGNSIRSLTDPFARMEQLAIEGIQSASEIPDYLIQQSQLRLSHALVRRLAVWKAVRECVEDQQLISIPRGFDLAAFDSALSNLDKSIANTGDDRGWVDFLMLDDLRRIAVGDPDGSGLAAETAQVVLSRIISTNVTANQRLFLDSQPVREFAEQLQPLAVAPVNYEKLLADLEQVEYDAEHRGYESIIDTMQSLRFSNDPRHVAVSQAIDTYYRNSNVRIAVSKKLIDRLMPGKKTLQRPVRQTILGADTRGNSHVDTDIRLTLLPDPQAWSIKIDLEGHIRSQTNSSRGPATLFNSSQSVVSTARDVRITPQGVSISGDDAKVNSKDSVRGIETVYDGLPFIGEMVRYMAEKEFSEKRGPARRIMQRSIATQTDTEFDKHLQERIDDIEVKLDERIFGPLRNLDLNPLVTDLQTTADRLVARYRIANDNSLAANCPRPQAPSDAVLSLQVHQSALNNSFSRLGLSDRPRTLLELAQSIATQFGQEAPSSLADDLPTDVLVQFEGDRPVLVEFIDGRLRLTLRISSLSQPNRLTLSNFVIRTDYVPAVSGLESQLIRDTQPSVEGAELRIGEKLALRAIFGKIFTAHSSIPLIQSSLATDPRLNGLAISQVVVEQGWMAVAISEESSPHVAILRELQVVR